LARRRSPAGTACRLPTAERTLLDLAESVRDPDKLGRLCDEMLRRRLLTVRRLQALALDHTGPGRRYFAAMRAALGDPSRAFDPEANE
jgi:hypothetical protein